jgi:hypothetical protein
MPRGGARNRSGPPADPTSGRSDARGYTLQTLPARARPGRPPAWPLPPMTSLSGIANDDTEAMLAVMHEREAAKWAKLWKTPQAWAWSMPGEEWRAEVVALYTRQFVLASAGIGGSAAMAQLHRLGDQIGMTTAGLAELGWKIVADAPKAAEPEVPAEDELAPKRRLRGA